jgi:Ca2+-binding RTX toxin-like protein
MPRLLVIAFVLAAVLLPAHAASAAVVQIHERGTPPALADLVFTGLPGEDNQVTISAGVPGTVVVRDAGPRLIAGENCTGGGGKVTCSGIEPQTSLQLEISLSDGDDRIAIDGPLAYTYSSLSGGPGNDIVLGGERGDTLHGGAGNDRLDGGAGDDELYSDPGADVLRGGSGIDTAILRDSASVTLDDRPDDGKAGEGDDVRSDIEDVSVGGGSSRVVGSAAANRLEGDEGKADLSGGAGDDTLIAAYEGGSLIGGPGRDAVTAQQDSEVDVRDGEVDHLECRSGLARPPLADPVDELVHCVPLVEVLGRSAPVHGHRAVLHIRCAAVAQRCRARVAMRSGRRAIGRATLVLRAGRRHPSVRLNRTGRQLLRLHRKIPVTVQLMPYRTAPAPCKGFPFTWRATLRRR